MIVNFRAVTPLMFGCDQHIYRVLCIDLIGIDLFDLSGGFRLLE
jgi:hypothetical protein